MSEFKFWPGASIFNVLILVPAESLFGGFRRFYGKPTLKISIASEL
jgi:hypothetical protein